MGREYFAWTWWARHSADGVLADTGPGSGKNANMDTACKCATVAIFVAALFGLAWAAGCIRVTEFFGAIGVGVMLARLFYLSVCVKSTDRYVSG